MNGSTARVYLLDLPYQADRLYDYKVPDCLKDGIKVGDIVAVLFGRGNRKKYAVVWELADGSEYGKLKNIEDVCGISVPTEMLGLCAYMKEHFFCTVGEAVRCLAPTYAIPSLTEKFAFVGDRADIEIPKYAVPAYELVKARKAVTDSVARKELGNEFRRGMSFLHNAGIITVTASVSSRHTPYEETVTLAEKYSGYGGDELCALVVGAKQKDVLSALALTGIETSKNLREKYGISSNTLKSLYDAGFVNIQRNEIERDPYAEYLSEITGKNIYDPSKLSETQKKAAERIGALLSSGKPAAALLYGVTGSGKTTVIEDAVDRTVKAGKTAIMLLPEIALTPQAVGIFYGRYGDGVCVLHSGLSDGERYDAWRKMRDGKCVLCIGTRSAVFAPMKNLGLIVIDEEQEHTYKSDSAPRYHARDIARYRCAKENATMLLASATPSLESYSRALEGRYTLVTLDGRYGNATLPELIVHDMRSEDGLPTIGSRLKREIQKNLESKEQTILFVNRRGFNSQLICPKCGKAIMCPHCSVAYTYHLRDVRNPALGYLSCHWCGSRASVPTACPDCGGAPLRHIGIGTQTVENELRGLFPGAEILRLDSDTTQTKFAYDEILGRFRKHKADILIGTQMVTKGHDFPGVTLVGVINADAAFYRSSYSASEYAFSLLTQVTGRSGRADKRGRAVIQTFSPHHPVINELTGGSYGQMYQTEYPLRRSLVFPPFCNMVLFLVSSADEKAVIRFTSSLAAVIKKAAEKIPMTVFGPMEAPSYRVGDVTRMQVVLKCILNAETRKILADIYASALKEAGNEIGLYIDVEPLMLG